MAMVGLCGYCGTPSTGDEAFHHSLQWHGDETTATYSDDQLSVTVSSHPHTAESQPVWTNDERIAIWLWGSIWGVDLPNGEYTRITEPPAASCATLYDTYGDAFISGLNGNFIGLIYDQRTQELTFFTDRLGTHPLHYARTDEGIVFSSNIQSFADHPAVDLTFDLDYLAEYFALKRAFGVKTPLEGVELLQPGSVTTISIDDFSKSVDRYWYPTYDPIDRSYSYYASRLASLVEQVALERTDTETEYGLLLSGGSDSRLTLAALTNTDASVRTYHINDWANTEAKLARRAATAVDADFTFLRRGDDYQARALATTPQISTFGGYFNQMHAAGFEERISADVDVLFTGHYGDMLFKGNHLPTPTVELGPVGSFHLPVENEIETVDEFIDHRARPAPSYLTGALDRSIREIYADNVSQRGERIIDHGVEYGSIREAVLCSRCPLTNGTSHFFYYGTLQMMPSGTLFLDNRLLELFLSIPIDYLVRGNLINRAIAQLSPELAAIPHGNTNVPLKHPFGLHWLGELGTSFIRRHVSSSPAGGHWTHGPWSNHAELIRSHDFVRETLDDHEPLIRRLPFLSWDGVNECYDAHLAGENKLSELYTLVTFLNMPVTEQMMAPSMEAPLQ